jgi:hypothetical protein
MRPNLRACSALSLYFLERLNIGLRYFKYLPWNFHGSSVKAAFMPQLFSFPGLPTTFVFS